MIESKFSVGDVVKLTCGGPKMTILDVQKLSTSAPAAYKTAWFVGDRVVSANFPEASLKKARA